MLNLYKTEKTARAAVKRQGLYNIDHEVKYMDARDSGYYVRFYAELIEDVHDLRVRGFDAVLATVKKEI